MLSRLVLLTLPLIAALAPSAEAAQVIFRGELTFVAASNCAYQTAGSNYGSTYTPRGVGDNGAHAVLTLVNDLNAAALQLANREFDATARTVTVTGIGASGYTAKAKLAVSYRYPAKATTSTRFQFLRGRILSPWSDPGVAGKTCSVTFEAAYVRD